ncbi:MAG: TrmB family transcriptional regulator [Patescibacteria group bacterium]|jgi:predicted transcriptional regulator
MKLEALSLLGFTANEATLYRTLLTLGETTPATLAKRSKLTRTYTYDLLRTLKEKGFVTSAQRNGKRHVSAVRPQQFKAVAEHKLAALDALIPELEGLYRGAAHKPTVRYFEGYAALEAVRAEIITEAKELRFFGATTDWIAHVDDWQTFAKQFVEKNIRVFDLVPRCPETLEYGQLYVGTTSRMRFAPPEWQFQANVAIWGNKTAFISYADEMHAVIIESAAITATLTTTFEILWKLGKRYG